MNICLVFEKFCLQINERMTFMSEDNIRYYWFASMLEQDNVLNHYSLEESYVDLPRKELDMLYHANNEDWCFEIKFHRHDTKSTFAHTMAAGEIYDDLQRLKYFRSASNTRPRRFFLYVTDSEMNKYFVGKNSSSNSYRKVLKDFYEGKSTCISLMEDNVPKTFWKEAFRSIPIKNSSMQLSTIKLIESKDLNCLKSISFQDGECHIRLYEII